MAKRIERIGKWLLTVVFLLMLCFLSSVNFAMATSTLSSSVSLMPAVGDVHIWGSTIAGVVQNQNATTAPPPSEIYVISDLNATPGHDSVATLDSKTGWYGLGAPLVEASVEGHSYQDLYSSARASWSGGYDGGALSAGPGARFWINPTDPMDPGLFGLYLDVFSYQIGYSAHVSMSLTIFDSTANATAFSGTVSASQDGAGFTGDFRPEYFSVFHSSYNEHVELTKILNVTAPSGHAFSYSVRIDGEASIGGVTTASAKLAILAPPGSLPGVGGIVVPVDKFGLLAPYVGLASTTMIGAVATVVYFRRVRTRKEKQ